MSEKRCLRNAAEDYCFFGNSKRTLYVQVPMTMSEKKLSKSQFVILNARFSTLNVHLLLQTCVYFVNSPILFVSCGSVTLRREVLGGPVLVFSVLQDRYYNRLACRI